MAESAREFFEELPGRIDPGRTRGTKASYRFDVDGAGSWRVELDNGDVRVSESESAAAADCVIQASEDTFMKIVRGEQNPATAYMLGKVKAKGDTGLALRLRDLFA